MASKPSFEQARAALSVRLRARRDEIEQALLTRTYAISDPAEVADPSYVEGLRAAVAAALEYGLASVEAEGERFPSVPAALLVQARVAARDGVGLDTVLRRYLAGYTLLGDFTIEEAQRDEQLGGTELKRLWRAQAARFDRLLAAVAEEYERAAENGAATSAQQRAALVRRLLEGELIDTSDLAYDFEAHHLALIATGPDVAQRLRDLSRTLDRRLLLAHPEAQVAWAWLGSRRPFEPEELERLLAAASWPEPLSLAIGEPGEGLPGWRLSHRQARAALPIAVQGPESAVRYADVALLASVLRDELLVVSLRRAYLEALEEGREGGGTARETLRAYFASGCNVSSAAAALGVKRHTVTNRLRAIEEALGRPLSACAAEIEVALRLSELDTSG